MKKIFFLSASLVLFIMGQSKAQDGLFIRLNGGYSLKASETDFPYYENSGDFSKTPSTYDSAMLTGTYGRGAKFGLAIGKMFNENVGFELGVNYLAGTKETIRETHVTIPVIIATTEAVATSEAYAHAISLTPTLVMQGSGDGLVPYARVGLVTPLGGKMVIESHATFNTTPLIGEKQVRLRKQKQEIRAKFNLGFKAAIGASLPISDRMNLFGEFELVSFTVKGKEEEIIEYEIITDGKVTQQLSDLSTADKKFTHVESINQNSNIKNNANFDKDKPTDKLETYVNLSGVSFNAGIWLRL